MFSAGQSHQSFSNGQSSNIPYANCLLLNMLHHSELIMTMVQHSASAAPANVGGTGRETVCKDRAMRHELSESQIQMKVRRCSILKAVYAAVGGIPLLSTLYRYLDRIYCFM